MLKEGSQPSGSLGFCATAGSTGWTAWTGSGRGKRIELTTGGIRCKTGAEIVRQSQALGKAYSMQYAAWKDQAGIQTAGFGIGLERLLRYMSGAETILEFVQYHDDGPNNSVNPEFIAEKRRATAHAQV